MTATLVAIIGLVMALVLVMRHGAMQRLAWPLRLQYAAIWLVVILAAMVLGNWVRPG